MPKRNNGPQGETKYTGWINVRVTERQRRLIEDAAKLEGLSLSDMMRNAAVARATDAAAKALSDAVGKRSVA